MENTRERRPSAGQKMRRKLLQRIGLGRTAILLLLVVSLINQLLLLLKVNYHFLFSTAVPYYLNWLAGKLGGAAGVTPLKVFSVIISLAIYAAYVACWMLSAGRRDFLKTALWLYGADTILLVVFAFALLQNPFSCLLELLIHLIGIVVLYYAHISAQELTKLARKGKRRPLPDQHREPRNLH